jgi:uncharacterized protein
MTIEVLDVPARSRYEVTVDGELAGFSEYRQVEGARVFTHTEVFDAYEGKGVGSALARGALDDVRAGGRRLVALCPFIAAYLERHGEYADLVDAELTSRLKARR